MMMMKHLFFFLFCFHVFFPAAAQDELEVLFHTLPSVPKNAVTTGPQAILDFEEKCQVVEGRLMEILDEEQAQREKNFKPLMDRTMKRSEIVAEMVELADKGELTDQKAKEFARQMEQYDEPESAHLSSQDAPEQDSINALRMHFGAIERERMEIGQHLLLINQEIDKWEEQYRQVKYNGGDLSRVRTELANAWKKKRKIYSEHNAKCLQKMHVMIRDNWSLLKKDQEQGAAIMHHYAVALKGFYSFYKISFWEKYLDDYGLKEADI